jgi:hypothetical protein
MRWKRQGRWNSIASTNRFLVRLVCCNSIKVSWPNAFHLTDIKSSFFRYRKEKLLAFFSTYSKTENSEKKTPLNLSFLQLIIIHVPEIFCWLVFVFLRLVVAIQICSHGEEYGQLITGLSQHYTLKDVSISISSSLYILGYTYGHSFYLTHWCTNSGAFCASPQLVSLRTIL